jgi:high-affinity iron transporter
MLLSSVLLILQDTLEAALLVSILLAISYQQWNRFVWLPLGIIGGMVLSSLYAVYMAEISEWFDYVGQEIVNAVLQILTTILIVVCTWALFKSRRFEARGGQSQKNRFTSLFIFCAAGAVALAITREASEILIYLGVFFQQKEYLPTVVAGSAIGFSIGLSIGILLYYGLLNLPGKWRLDVPVFLMALVAGNMLSQAALQLIQADWISSTRALWDTSDWLPENSIIGQLLSALVGYEATPSAAQLVAYIVGVILVLAFGAAGKYSKNNDPTTIQTPS